MTEKTSDMPSELGVIAGPLRAFGLRWVDPAHLSGGWDDRLFSGHGMCWLGGAEREGGHSMLTSSDDRRALRTLARSLREDFDQQTRPLIVLPQLSQEALPGAVPPLISRPAREVLRELMSMADLTHVTLRLVSIDGLDDVDSSVPSANEEQIVAHLQDADIDCRSISAQRIRSDNPAFWRMAWNWTSTSEDGAAVAQKFVAGLSPAELATSEQDPDGRDLLALAGDESVAPVPSGRSIRRDRTQGLAAASGLDLKDRSVLFVCEKLADRSGGAERVMIELANALSCRGYLVEIVSHETRGVPPFYPLDFGVVHTNLSPRGAQLTIKDRLFNKAKSLLQRRELPSPLDRQAFAIRYRQFHRRLANHIDGMRPDVVVPFMPPAIVATALADSTHRPRVVASMHNAPEQDFENPERWDPGAYARRRRVELMDHMNRIGVLLPEYRDWYPPHLQDRVSVLPNAVEPVDPRLLEQTTRNPTILAVGRLADTKRHDLSLRAFAALAGDFPDWQLRIFGVGPFERKLTAMRDELGLGGRAHILGHTSEILQEYLSASILCHPARFEGFPLAVTESLAAGLPVVGFSDCTGVNSLVADGQNGVLMDPGDGTDDTRLRTLVTALRRLIEHSEEREKLGRGGPPSMEPYRPDRVVDMWETVLFPE